MTHDETDTTPSKDLASENVTDINTFKAKMGRPKKEKSEDPPPKQAPISVKEEWIRELLRGLPSLNNYCADNSLEQHPYRGSPLLYATKLPFEFKSYDINGKNKKVFVEIWPHNNTAGNAVMADIDSTTSTINNFLTELNKKLELPWLMSDKQVETAVKSSMRARSNNRDLPRPMGFHSTPDLCFNRLSYDPYEIPDNFDLDQVAPVANTVIKAMRSEKSNVQLSDIFFQFAGRALTYDTDRKQALYIYGKTNGGKSSILLALKEMFGDSYVEVDDEILLSEFGMPLIENKRIVVINEAENKSKNRSKSRFLNSAKFKQLTGDKTMVVNEKKESLRVTAIDCHFIFVSNYLPEIARDNTSVLSRLTFIHVHQLTSKKPQKVVEAAIKNEARHLASYALHKFNALDDKTSLKNLDFEAIEEINDKAEEYFESIFHGHFEADDESRGLPNDVILDKIKHTLRTKHETDNFLSFLLYSGLVKYKKRVTIGAHKKFVYFGIKLRVFAPPVPPHLDKK